MVRVGVEDLLKVGGISIIELGYPLHTISCHLQQWLQGQRSPRRPRTETESFDTLESVQTQNADTYKIK